MSASSLSPEEIRAAAGAHQELGPEYSDAVVTSFLDKIDKDIAARVDARLAGTPQAEPAKPENSTLLTGIAIGTAMGTFPLLLAMSLARGDQAVQGPLQWLLALWIVVTVGCAVGAARARGQSASRRKAIDP